MRKLALIGLISLLLPAILWAGQHPLSDRQPEIWATLNPGTELFVRVNEPINAQTEIEGRMYSASIARDVVDRQKNVLIPRGSAAALVIRRIDPGGSHGIGNYVLDLDSVRVNGRKYLVDTLDNRVAHRRAGGGALGTFLGATGAAAGGGTRVLTRGREIRVPAETVLNYQLEEPLHMHETR
jgi:hypothetical protein